MNFSNQEQVCLELINYIFPKINGAQMGHNYYELNNFFINKQDIWRLITFIDGEEWIRCESEDVIEVFSKLFELVGCFHPDDLAFKHLFNILTQFKKSSFHQKLTREKPKSSNDNL